ncbi:hypothetical protein [Bacillus sp. 7884-1]|nr:hypothetical protein [Bacillus sp. 7884-1]
METIKSMFKHVQWANQRILEALQNGAVENKQANFSSRIFFMRKIFGLLE